MTKMKLKSVVLGEKEVNLTYNIKTKEYIVLLSVGQDQVSFEEKNAEKADEIFNTLIRRANENL